MHQLPEPTSVYWKLGGIEPELEPSGKGLSTESSGKPVICCLCANLCVFSYLLGRINRDYQEKTPLKRGFDWSVCA